MATAIRGMPGSEFEPRRPLHKSPPIWVVIFFACSSALTVVSAGSQPLPRPAVRTLPRNRLASSAAGGASALSSMQKKAPICQMEAFSYAASVQMPPVVAAGVDALLHDEERLGIHLLHHLLQRADLVLAQAHAQHLYLVAGIGAVGRPVRHAAVQLFDDEADQLRIILLGEDQHLHIDVLLVQFIQKQVAQDIVDSGVDGRGGVEQEQAQRVQTYVEADAEPAHGELGILLAEVQTQNVQTTGGTAAAQHQPRGEAHAQAADKAAGQRVCDDGHGGGGYQRRKDGVAHGDDGGLDEKRSPQSPIGQIEHGQIRQQVQQARQIEGHIHPRPRHQQGTDHLAQTVGAACVEALRHDEQVDGRRHDGGAHDAAQQAQPALMQDLIIDGHFVPSSPVTKGIICTRSCKVKGYF